MTEALRGCNRMDSVAVKQCVDCGEAFPAASSDFRLVNNRNGRPGNLLTYCRSCERIRGAKYRALPGKAERRAAANEKWMQKRIATTQRMDRPNVLKECPRCKISQPHTNEFYGLANRKPGGFNCYCKECVRVESTLKRAANPGYARAYYLNNKAALLTDCHERYHSNRDAIRERERTSRKNPEVLAKLRVHNHKRRAQKHAAAGKFTKRDLEAKLILQDQCCYYCLIPLNGRYTIEHKIPLSRGGSNWPANIAAACERCNFRKNNKTVLEFRQMSI